MDSGKWRVDLPVTEDSWNIFLNLYPHFEFMNQGMPGIEIRAINMVIFEPMRTECRTVSKTFYGPLEK